MDLGAVRATLSAAPGSPYADLEHRPTVGSTNTEVRRDPRPWRVVSADEQTAGRGRLDRSWSTTPGTALAVSVLVPLPPEPAWVPLAAGLAVRAAIRDVTGLEAGLKWPNDVLLPGPGGPEQKVCGILCELLPEGVVVGAGLNVHHAEADLPVPTATSLRLAGAPGVDRGRLLAAYLLRLAEVHRDLVERPGELRRRYLAACTTVGRRVRLTADGRTTEADVEGVDEEGRLVGRDADGRAIVVAAGDVVHVRPAT